MATHPLWTSLMLWTSSHGHRGCHGRRGVPMRAVMLKCLMTTTCRGVQANPSNLSAPNAVASDFSDADAASFKISPATSNLRIFYLSSC
ncbi:hypothetical protein BDN67DRAFT_459021 [Paxillus ammoniavirescens]|nr:hypothetical protein BDN67DRAFT_459021 [Paxillus ammoniavirescens]